MMMILRDRDVLTCAAGSLVHFWKLKGSSRVDGIFRPEYDVHGLHRARAPSTTLTFYNTELEFIFFTDR